MSKIKITFGKFSDDVADVFLNGEAIGELSRDYVDSFETGKPVLGCYHFEISERGMEITGALDVDIDDHVTAVTWKGFRVRKASEALAMLREKIVKGIEEARREKAGGAA